jgi:hypothetical protein
MGLAAAVGKVAGRRLILGSVQGGSNTPSRATKDSEHAMTINVAVRVPDGIVVASDSLASSRRMRGVRPVQSTIVEAALSGRGPASRTQRSSPAPKAAAAAHAASPSEAGGLPRTFALVEVRGSPRSSTILWATGCDE